MLRRPPDAPVLTALVGALASSTGVTGTATKGTFSEVPQGTVAPYNKVTVVTGRRADTLGGMGKSMLVDVDSVSEGASQSVGLAMRAAVVQALDFQRPSLTSGHVVRGLSYEDDTYFAEMVDAKKTHHHVATFRVWSEQTS